MSKLQSVLIRQTGRSTVKAGCYDTFRFLVRRQHEAAVGIITNSGEAV